MEAILLYRIAVTCVDTKGTNVDSKIGQLGVLFQRRLILPSYG